MSKKILIVDDDESLSSIVRLALEKHGFEVITANNGNSAMTLLKTQIPDLIIADLTMPGMDGWRFTMKVRQDPRFVKTPIIVCSGLLEEEKPAESYESANLYLPKPFDIMELIEKIKAFLYV